MLPYWLFLFIPALAIFSGRQLNERSRSIVWFCVWIFFSVAIGFRHEVGGDWFNYIRRYQVYGETPIFSVLSGGDPLYYLITWLAVKSGASIHAVNLICGMIASAGIVRFASIQPLPWLALFVSVPYLIIVVSMGYTRQSAALGFLLLGLVSLGRGRPDRFVIWVLLGAAFHKSAVLMLPVAALASTSNRFWSAVWIGLISLVGGYFFVFDSADQLWANYVEADMQSQGGLLRVLMNAVPALLFLLYCRRIRLGDAERQLWWWMSIMALVCIPLVMVSSTATDRVALYLIPLQLYVFSRLPFIFSDPKFRALIVAGVVGYYTLVQAVWLFFASHAYAWIPYRSILVI